MTPSSKAEPAAARLGESPQGIPKILMPGDWCGMPHNWLAVTDGRRIIALCENRGCAERVIAWLRAEQ